MSHLGDSDSRIVGGDSRHERHDNTAVFDKERHYRIKHTEENTRSSIDMLHNRIEFFSEFDSEFRNTLLRLVDSRLSRVIEDFIFLSGGSRLPESLVRLAHLPLHLVEVHGERGKHLRHTSRIETHLLESRGKHHRGILEAHVLTHILQCFKEHQQAVFR